MTTPSYSGVAREAAVSAFEAAWGGRPDLPGTRLLHGYADAVLAAVKPLIRQEIAEEIASVIDDMAAEGDADTNPHSPAYVTAAEVARTIGRRPA